MSLNNATLKKSLLELAPFYRNVIFFGFFTNFLVLAPSWYMLEVYDRVIYSRNTTTLAMLTVMVVFLYLIMESLEWVRVKMMHQASLQVEQQLQSRVFDTAFQAKLKSAQFPVHQVFSDFKALKESLSSQAFMSLVDIPYVSIFLVAIFFIHPLLALLTLVGLALQMGIAFFNQYRIQPLMKLANQHALEAQAYFGSVNKRAEVVQAMGMLPSLQGRWQDRQQQFLLYQSQASEIAGKNAATSKLLQIMQASLVLGLGCYLVIHNEMAYGAAGMIVASILAARVLSPFIQLVGQWRTLAAAQDAYSRLENLFANYPLRDKGMSLPPPTGEISVENVTYALSEQSKADPGKPVNREPVLRNVSLRIQPGETLLVAGPSASGKSTLARLVAGLLPASSGKVRFNGVDAYHWSKEELGPHIGYLSQDIELLDGSIADNIARFGEPDAEKLQAAIDLLGLQPLIDSLPDGINTQIGSEGEFLSGGRRQLIGLARAIYGNPRIVILDEPNANLDEAGDRTLQSMVRVLKKQGTTFVIISHLQGIKAIADYLLILMNGQVMRFGKPDEVMASLNPTPLNPAKAEMASASQEHSPKESPPKSLKREDGADTPGLVPA